jgi:7-cyano-7-deazaguanine synthase in queuosine biosynthesis
MTLMHGERTLHCDDAPLQATAPCYHPDMRRQPGKCNACQWS